MGRQDVTRGPAPWLMPLQEGLFGSLLNYYAPGSTTGVRSHIGPDGSLVIDGYDYKLGDLKGYGGPDMPYNEFSPVTSRAQQDTLAMAKGGNPYADAAHGYVNDALSRDSPSRTLADMAQAYAMGGPLAGASRAVSLEGMTGAMPKYGQQALLDAMYGKSANAGDESIYNMLTRDAKLSSGGAFETQYGRGAGTARDYTAAAARGNYTDPASNPMLDATYKRAARAMGDEYRDATQPGIAAAFARAGAFGGSAQQNTESKARYGLGRNLEELATNVYGGAYENERGRQQQAALAERGFTEQMLGTERQRQYQAAEEAARRRQEAGQLGWSAGQSIAGRERELGTNAAQSFLQRGASMLPYLPGLRGLDYIDLEQRRNVGNEIGQMDYENKLTEYQNNLNRFQYQEEILPKLFTALGPLLGANIWERGWVDNPPQGGGFSLPKPSDLL